MNGETISQVFKLSEDNVKVQAQIEMLNSHVQALLRRVQEFEHRLKGLEKHEEV